MAAMRLADVTLWHSTLALGVVALAFVSAHVLHRLLLSPLRHVPGPLHARLVGAGDFFHKIAARRSVRANGIVLVALAHFCQVWIDALHERYGPIVLVSPNLVRCIL
jgi:hypothetical protein